MRYIYVNGDTDEWYYDDQVPTLKDKDLTAFSCLPEHFLTTMKGVRGWFVSLMKWDSEDALFIPECSSYTSFKTELEALNHAFVWGNTDGLMLVHRKRIRKC